MKLNHLLVPIAALAIGLAPSAGAQEERAQSRNRGTQQRDQARQASREGRSADRAGARGERSNRDTANQDRARAARTNRDTANQDRARGRADAPSARRGSEASRRGDGAARNNGRNEPRGRDDRAVPYDSRDRDRGRGRVIAPPRGNNRGRSLHQRSAYRYYAPRPLARRFAPPRYYGRGGHLSVYFGVGSGYRYGSYYSGRVYGYRGRDVAYGQSRYYGDLRLKIQPRDAAVYVDGYYAGIVDDFDGFFQRLTLEIGPHRIEIDAPGLESQVFDVYVDPDRTIDLHADLLR